MEKKISLRATTSATFTTLAMHEAQEYTSGRVPGEKRGKKLFIRYFSPLTSSVLDQNKYFYFSLD